jgi:hypothetical protein
MNRDTVNNLIKLSICSANNTTPDPSKFSKIDVDNTIREELRGSFSNINNFMRDRYDIYEIMINVIDDVVPKQVMSNLGLFAEIKTVPQGSKAIFKKKIGRNRAKSFLTQAGLSGVYETFRLDTETIEVSAKAIGGGARIDFERLLDGAENMSDLLDVITEGFELDIFLEVQNALKAAFNNSTRPANNKVTANTFSASSMVSLVNTVKAYGQSAVIFAPDEFIAQMGPDAIVPVISGVAQGVYDPSDISEIHNNGRIKIFRGTPVVQLPQSFTDETNTHTWVDPQYAYVLPTGGEKVVKVVLEGETQMHDFVNRDNSIELHAYKKLGVAILTNHNWGIYRNTGIAQTYESPYGF